MAGIMLEAKSIDDLLTAAIQYHRGGRTAEAGALYRQVLDRDPDNYDANHLLGIIRREDDPFGGIELCLKAVRLRPDVPAARHNMIRCFDLLFPQIRDDADRVVRLIALLDSYLSSLSLPDEQFHIVRVLVQSGYGEIATQFMDGISAGDDQFIYAKCQTMKLLGQVERARDQLLALIDADPTRLDYWELMADIALSLPDHHFSKRVFEQVVRLDPGNERAMHMLNCVFLDSRFGGLDTIKARHQDWKRQSFRHAGRRRAIVTSSDAAYFGLTKGLVQSLARLGLRDDVAICFIDAGCRPDQLAWLAPHVDHIAPPPRQLDFPENYPAYVRTHIVRSLIPETFPGFDQYLWLDCDMWVQYRDAVELYFFEADAGKIAATCDVDRSYINRYWNEQFYLREINDMFEIGFGKDYADKYRYKANFNSGGFCAAADSPVWRRYQENIVRGLAHAANNHRFHHTIEGAAFVLSLYSLGNVAVLPSYCNWQCGFTAPFRDPDGVVREPTAPFHPIGIVHLTIRKARRGYHKLGLLFDQGAGLTEDEIAGFS